MSKSTSRKKGVSPVRRGDDLFTGIRQDKRDQAVDERSIVIVASPLTSDQLTEFGHWIVAKKEQFGWANKAHNDLVCDYVKALAAGDGRTPDGLVSPTIRTVQRSFMDFCDRNDLAYTVEQFEPAAAS